MKSKKKSNRGGKREGSGQKLKYGEPTTTISFRVPVSKSDNIQSVVNDLLNSYKTNNHAN